MSDAAGNMLKVGATTAFTMPKALNNVSIIPLTSRIDDDGDSNFTITGNYQGVWKDKNGTTITSLIDSLTICNAPYTLTLSTTGSASIATQYGDPNKTDSPNATAKFTINPTAQPSICFAKPDMTYSVAPYAGPATTWDTTKGFITQSITPATYNTNFLTTGSNGLYFDLDIAGVSTMLTWNPVTVGSITATMTYPTSSTNTVRVTLTGPAATAAQRASAAPRFITKPTLPATFEVKGKGGSILLKYGFVIKKWFINGSDSSSWGTKAGVTSWCASTTNYIIPTVADLTNASGTTKGIGAGQLIPTVGNPSTGNYSVRGIDGRYLDEWSANGEYSLTFTGTCAWTSTILNSYDSYVHKDGSVGSQNSGLCPKLCISQ